MYVTVWCKFWINLYHVILLPFILFYWWVRFPSCSYFKNLAFCFNVHQGTNLCTIGTTSKLIAGNGGWFYYSCGWCTKKTDHEDVAYTCSCGKFNEKSIMRCVFIKKFHFFVCPYYHVIEFMYNFRYWVEIMVCHGKGSTTFVFWDHDYSRVIGMSVADLRNIMIQASFEIEIVCFSFIHFQYFY